MTTSPPANVPKYGQVVLASDRDLGLYVLQYAGGV
jgi:hypothetical protein